MKIRKKLYYEILRNLPAVPPETGGILGKSGGIICEAIFDMKNIVTQSAIYKPDTAFLNRCISEWSQNDIEFAGIFHSHPDGCNGLSGGDIDYIKKIMVSLSGIKSELFFPLVFPGKKILSFRAFTDGKNVVVTDDAILFY